MARTVREAAMDYLSRREHTTHELAQKLLNKEYEAEEVHEALEQLTAEGLLSDERFVEAFVFHRMQRGSGPFKIHAELRQKGVSDAMIAQFLDERDNAWLNIAQDVRVKKFGPLLPSDMKEKARQARFLQQRGFTHEQTRSALRDDDFY
ncbi:MAG: regulatory protein RecX [Gammaproteobacteria bacterium]|jgi:regulatory protein